MSVKVLVVGSINVDLTIKVAHLPAPGETIHGSEPQFLPGGKGGNQAVSVAASGAEVMIIGAVGEDGHGAEALVSLKLQNVDTQGVDVKSSATGTAFIFIEGSGENLIVVTAGANSLVTPTDVEAKIKALGGENPVVLCQLELPIESVEQAARVADELDGRFILNLAPAAKISDYLMGQCNPLIVNETEAMFLTGQRIANIDDALKAVQELAGLTKSAVITLGGDGAVWSDGQVANHKPSEKVQVVDTTGAGDAFVGALAAAFSQGKDLAQAVADGLTAGAKTVQHFGAQPPKAEVV